MTSDRPAESPSRRKLSLLKCPLHNLSNLGIIHALLGRTAVNDLRPYLGNGFTPNQIGTRQSAKSLPRQSRGKANMRRIFSLGLP